MSINIISEQEDIVKGHFEIQVLITREWNMV